MKEIDQGKIGEFAALFKGSLASYLVGLYIFAFYLEIHLRFPVLQTIRFQFTFGAIVGLICLLRYLNDKNKSSNFQTVTKITFFLIFIFAIYTVFSLDREESFKIFSDRVLKFILVSFFIYAAVEKIQDLRVIVAFMLLAWLKIGSEGFLGWATGSLVWENQGIPRLHGSTVMFQHPNSFSGFGVGCLPYAVFLLMCVKNNILRVGLLALLIFSLVIVINTGSRSGYVAVLLGATYFFMKLKAGKVKVILLVFATILATISFVPDYYKERFGSIFTGEEKEGHSSESRILIIEDALSIYAQYPLGIGVQAFPKVRNDIFGRPQNTHNLYLEVLTNIGPIGFIAFFAFVSKLISLNKINIQTIERKHSPLSLDNHLLVNLSKATIGFLLIRLLLGLFGMDLYEIYWWIALGITLSVSKLLFIEQKNAEKGIRHE